MAPYEVPESIRLWVNEVAALTMPDAIQYIDGSEEESQKILDKMVKDGTFIPLNPEKHPHCYLALSNPDDVARVEDKTFICSENEAEAGPTNHFMAPAAAKEKLNKLFLGCMKGRTMYVIPFCLGPLNSPYARYGVEISDSPYVVVNMRIMTRAGKQAIELMKDGPFVKCLHSVGVPLKKGEKDVSWPCNPKDLMIAHFPQTMEVLSFGSGYGGNALLSKKCYALRLASCMAQKQGWLAEHMLIISVTNPAGEKMYMVAAFPSACGKTNLAMLKSTLPGWKVETVGDDIAWLFWDEKGNLRAINPEFGFFGVAPGTSPKTNEYALESMRQNSLFTNVAKTQDGDVWWEGLTDTPPEGLTTWLKEPYDPASGKPAAHPNARFTAPIKQCPILDPAWNDPNGVPISAIIFGGRRQKMVPLIREASSWEQGVFFGASMTSETTAAAKGVVGKVRNDPFAMLPFCGYNMGDYFGHWLSMNQPQHHTPKIFYVNWFLKNDQGNFAWPGFGENIRVLAWIFDRMKDRAEAIYTPVGQIPAPDSLDLPKGVKYEELFPLDIQKWLTEFDSLKEYFSSFREHLPPEISKQLEKMVDDLSNI